ncbi:MAG: peptidase S41 [Bacteroidia bacterium]|nr:peptidase S41 [Bacteroidia bacterium]NNM23985.1 peptidase S41 [Flavobacteriaceae bacterium]
MKKTYFLLALFVSTLFISCFEDLDDSLQPASTLEIQQFIWRGLNFYYLYKADTQELANDAFATESELQTFLGTFDTPESLFDFLIAPQDQFSRLYQDYNEIESALEGTSASNGMEYGLVLYPDQSGNVFGYVRYVLPNSDAANKGLVRGIIFNTVDGQQITDTNFNDLLAPTTYTLGLATYDGQNITPTGNSVELVKSELQENPIHVSRTIDLNGVKVGYLLYNGFTNEFDNQLNDVFAQFQSDGVTELVLDLRYNSGGSVQSSTYLASMVTGQFTGQTYYTEQWNEDRQPEFASDGLFVDSFINGGPAINSLNLGTVYILTTARTASASELVINGLAPYINVVQIGDNTRGKYQASFLLYDSPNFLKTVELNPNHTYAMLPLVFQTANANGFTNFDNGLIPDIDQNEDYTNLGVLGDENEPLLATALGEISGLPAPGGRGFVEAAEHIWDSKANSPLYEIMVAKRD